MEGKYCKLDRSVMMNGMTDMLLFFTGVTEYQHTYKGAGDMKTGGWWWVGSEYYKTKKVEWDCWNLQRKSLEIMKDIAWVYKGDHWSLMSQNHQGEYRYCW